MPFPPQNPPLVIAQSTAGGGTGGASWAYAYVDVASVKVPANTPATLCTVRVGPGTWRFHSALSMLVDPKGGSATWTLDMASGPGNYYGASTGYVSGNASIVSVAGLGIGAFAAETDVHLRFQCRADAEFVASAFFDTGPTVLLVAERISESTAALP